MVKRVSKYINGEEALSHPKSLDILVTKCGIVEVDGKIIEHKLYCNGLRAIHGKKGITGGVARLIMETWFPLHEETGRIIIKYKDSNHENVDSSNLEWVNLSPIKYYLKRTPRSEVEAMSSLDKVSKAVGVTKASISGGLKESGMKVFSSGIIVSNNLKTIQEKVSLTLTELTRIGTRKLYYRNKLVTKDHSNMRSLYGHSKLVGNILGPREDIYINLRKYGSNFPNRATLTFEVAGIEYTIPKSNDEVCTKFRYSDIAVQDIITGKITTYKDISKIRTALGIGDNVLFNRLRNSDTSVFKPHHKLVIDGGAETTRSDALKLCRYILTDEVGEIQINESTLTKYTLLAKECNLGSVRDMKNDIVGHGNDVKQHGFELKFYLGDNDVTDYIKSLPLN